MNALAKIIVLTTLHEAYRITHSEKVISDVWIADKLMRALNVTSLDDIDSEKLAIDDKFYLLLEMKRLVDEIETEIGQPILN